MKPSLALLAAALLTGAGAASGVPGDGADGGSGISIRPAAPDPERQARLREWWSRMARAEPALARTVRQLRGARRAWHVRATAPVCRRARGILRQVDRRRLLDGAEYAVAQDVGRALDELDRAAVACLERRYFELDYRLRVAESALARARDTVRAELARRPAP